MPFFERKGDKIEKIVKQVIEQIKILEKSPNRSTYKEVVKEIGRLIDPLSLNDRIEILHRIEDYHRERISNYTKLESEYQSRLNKMIEMFKRRIAAGKSIPTDEANTAKAIKKRIDVFRKIRSSLEQLKLIVSDVLIFAKDMREAVETAIRFTELGAEVTLGAEEALEEAREIEKEVLGSTSIEEIVSDTESSGIKGEQAKKLLEELES
ncbi:MAG: hypothetical protein J7L07_03050 [Candidatus Odinarchaeota archaeon]|nr:hypothetical protein [Candidatus Odinarchaeota archaeon]